MTSWQGAEQQLGQGRTELAGGMPGHGFNLYHAAAITRSIFRGKHKGISTQACCQRLCTALQQQMASGGCRHAACSCFVPLRLAQAG